MIVSSCNPSPSPSPSPPHSTIRRHAVEAKQILGERLYVDLDMMIYENMDRARYPNSVVHKVGEQVICAALEKDTSLNAEVKENKVKLPPFKGRYYHDIFGIGKPDYSSK